MESRLAILWILARPRIPKALQIGSNVLELCTSRAKTFRLILSTSRKTELSSYQANAMDDLDNDLDRDIDDHMDDSELLPFRYLNS
jgi:hypothetical protein